MRVGFNYPWAWNKYGLYFGPSSESEPWIGRWLELLPGNLRRLKHDLGIDLVRIFLVCNGANYGPVPRRLQRWWGERWSFDPPDEADPRYAQDLVAMLAIFRDEGVQVLPSFIDFGFFGAPGDNGASGRCDAANDAQKRARLLHFLETLVRASVPFAAQIYAWEVVNEPSWNTRWFAPALAGGGGARRYRPIAPTVSRETMRAFLGEACQRIEGPGLASTIGHALYEDLASLPRGSKPQFHYYGALSSPWGGIGAKLGLAGTKIPPFSEVKRIFGGAFLGEIGTRLDQGIPWPELHGADTRGAEERVLARLSHVASLGYELALLWPDLDWLDPNAIAKQRGEPQPTAEEFGRRVTDPLRLSDGAARAIVRFTGGPEHEATRSQPSVVAGR